MLKRSLALCSALSTFVALALLPAGTSAAPAKPPASAQARLHQIGERYFEASLQLDPLRASELLGEARFEDKLSIDIAPAHLRRDRQLQQQLLRELRALPQDQLPEPERLSLALLQRQAEDQLAAMAFPGELLPIDHYGGMPVTLAQLGTGQGVQVLSSEANYRHFLKRLQALPAWNAQAMANMREGVRRGIVQPRALTERAIETLRPLAEADAEHSAFTLPLRQFPAHFSAAQRQRLSQAYRKTWREQLQPSMAALLRFMQQDYLPHARTSAGLGALPNGAAWYAMRVREATTTALTPEAIHQLGLAEVARIHAEMDKLKPQLGGSGPLSAFLAEYNQRPALRPFKTDAEVLAAYAAINQKVETQLPRLFKLRPKAALEIRAEPEISKATASAHYMSAASDGSRPGVFFEVITAPGDIATTGMTSLFLHEGQPGHHFQIALQAESTLPRFRRYSGNDAFIEGWALYAESLGHEMGLYANDADALLGHLSADLHRAVRLVTDTGLHAKGWTREQSMRYMMDAEGIDEADARRSTERYMAWPGQALAYKIGALKIRELRDLAQARLGANFSYADFHEQVLGDGALPLDLLEVKLKQWLARQGK
ncbi:DUF885 domain-containing protein [Roseateles sp. PN1]|uniref:DUF885 domain-containing protein n=1 Tax=Roseateles sp. PN1 TaxID=3137372 RepID=UPI003138BE7F